jgi:hypothetical protein
MIAMKRLGLAVLALLFFSQAAVAQSWSLLSFATTPQNAPKVLAAGDALMSSPAGKEFPGKLMLQMHVADGANPATHSWVPIYKSGAEREAFVQKLQADPAWDTFLATITELAQPVAQVAYRTVKSWGEIVDTDHLWISHAFSVDDPAAFLAAVDGFMASATGQKFPGQVYLSAVVAGGLTPVTHLISVGYASEAEMESWIDVRNASADWATYIDASRPTGDYLGSNMVRDLKAWGPATFADLTGR